MQHSVLQFYVGEYGSGLLLPSSTSLISPASKGTCGVIIVRDMYRTGVEMDGRTDRQTFLERMMRMRRKMSIKSINRSKACLHSGREGRGGEKGGGGKEGRERAERSCTGSR